MTDPALVRRIELTGWSTVLLGFLCVVLGAIQAATPYLLSRMAELLDAADDPTGPMRDAMSAGAGMGAAVNGAFGAALVVIGFGVARRMRWSHPALTASGWVSILVLAVLAKPTLAPLFVMAGRDAGGGKGMFWASVVLMLAQVAAVLWFLRFWSRADVRAAFR